jgi:hypothetical protein
MDKPTLVEADLNAGKKLLALLDKARLNVKAAFWLYVPEADEWRLFFALPVVARKGPKEAYEKVQAYLEQLGTRELSLKNVSLVSPKDNMVRLLESAMKTGPGISGIRFTGNVIDNVLIEDAYIYRVA